MGRLLIAAALILVWAASTVGTAAGSQATPPYVASRPFGTLREQAAVQQAWLKERLQTNRPKVMRDHGVDMWVAAMREYNEDPVFLALVSPTSFAERRRTSYILFDRGEPNGVERIALGGGSMGGLYATHRTELETATGQRAELWDPASGGCLPRSCESATPRRSG